MHFVFVTLLMLSLLLDVFEICRHANATLKKFGNGIGIRNVFEMFVTPWVRLRNRSSLGSAESFLSRQCGIFPIWMVRKFSHLGGPKSFPSLWSDLSYALHRSLRHSAEICSLISSCAFLLFHGERCKYKSLNYSIMIFAKMHTPTGAASNVKISEGL